MAKDQTHKLNGQDEILPWLFIADDNCTVICNKDSSLLAAWRFDGVDIESGYDGFLEDAADALDNAVRGIADYQPVIWTRVDRRPFAGYPRGTFKDGDDVPDGIDRVWGEQFANAGLFQNYHHIAIAMPVIGGALSVGEMTRNNIDSGMKPPVALFEAIKSKYVGNQKRLGFTTRNDLDVMLTRFEQAICSPITNGSIGITVDRLKGSGLLGFLRSTVSAGSASGGPAPVAVDHYEYLDTYLSDSFIDNRAADYILLDGLKKQYVAVFTLKKAPSNDRQQFLHNLLSLPVSLSVASCWKSVSIKEAETYLNSTRTFDEMRSMEMKSLLRQAFRRDYDVSGDGGPTTEVGVLAMEMKNEVRQQRAFCGWLTTTVMVYADTPELLNVSCELVAKSLETSGLVFIREREGALSGFCVGIPGQMTEPVRWHFAEASNLTDVTPLITFSSGEPRHPFFSESVGRDLPPTATFRTRHNTPYYFNNHVGQLGHTLLIGPSRNGKTMLQMFLESQFLKYPNARIFNIDKDYSLQPQTLLFDGEYIDLDPGKGDLRVNPVSMAKDDIGKAWLIGWLDRLLAYRGSRPTDKEIAEVAHAVNLVADIPGARLTSLMSQLPDSLRVRLAPWCEGGAWGRYFDNEEDNFSFARIMSVEVGGLINAGLTDIVNAFTEYAFYRIERYLMERTDKEIGPTMVYFEEAGFLLDDEIFASKARDYLMTLAKKKAFLVMTAQSPEPFVVHQKLGAAVRDNVATIIFMPNSMAARELGDKYKRAFGVNDVQLDIIARARPQREYCVFHPQTGLFRVVDARFPPQIVAALRSDAQSRALFHELYTPQEASWKERYLDQVMRV
jgi:type IV secretory pathway VirB4 component